MSHQLCQSSSQSIDLKVVIDGVIILIKVVIVGVEKMLHTIDHKCIIIEEKND